MKNAPSTDTQKKKKFFDKEEIDDQKREAKEKVCSSSCFSFYCVRFTCPFVVFISFQGILLFAQLLMSMLSSYITLFTNNFLMSFST